MAERTVSPVMYLRANSLIALEAAEDADKSGKPSFYHRMNAMLLSALCLESFINYWGPEILLGRTDLSSWHTCWKRVERRGPRKKVEAICEMGKLTVPDFLCEPFKTMGRMFEYRNNLAHGKTEHLVGNETSPLWERECTIENARKFVQATEEIADWLCSRSDCDNPMGSSDAWSGTYAEIEPPLETGE